MSAPFAVGSIALIPIALEHLSNRGESVTPADGMIERSNRTAHEELFHHNYQRPHQGIGNQTPMPRYRHNYVMHAATHMLTY